MNTGDMVRQGDVPLTRVSEIPADAVPVGDPNGEVILAFGERTGHAHRIVSGARLYQRGDLRFIAIGRGGAKLVHEEHATIELEGASMWRVGEQREYTPDAIQRVED